MLGELTRGAMAMAIDHCAENESGSVNETVTVTPYQGPQQIRQMAGADGMGEAFIQTQHEIEKILWDRIVGLFRDERAMVVRRTIEEAKKGKDKSDTKTYELIKWAHFLGALDEQEWSDLLDFNRKRNARLHEHGAWWDSEEDKEGLEKGVRFIEKNGF